MDTPQFAAAAIGTFFAAVSAFFAWRAVVAAKASTDELAKTTMLLAETTELSARILGEAEATRATAEANRQNAVADRHHERLIRVGELVEILFAAAQPDARYSPPTPPNDDWRLIRNRLRQAKIGVTIPLPFCDLLLGANTYEQVLSNAPLARGEIDSLLIVHAVNTPRE